MLELVWAPIVNDPDTGDTISEHLEGESANITQISVKSLKTGSSAVSDVGSPPSRKCQPTRKRSGGQP